jgi:hypothetical protein
MNATHLITTKRIATGVASFVLLAGLPLCGAQTGKADLQPAKAYKTLNFGDDRETVERKLADIVADGKQENAPPEYIEHTDTLWKSLFDTAQEYEPYKFDGTRSTQSDKLSSLMRCFQESVGVEVSSCRNSAFSVTCYLLNNKPKHGNDGLAVVEVSYERARTSRAAGPMPSEDPNKLTETLTQSFPNARKDSKSYQIESTVFPGLFLVYNRIFYLDVGQNRKAVLSIPTQEFSFAFTEPSATATAAAHSRSAQPSKSMCYSSTAHLPTIKSRNSTKLDGTRSSTQMRWTP